MEQGWGSIENYDLWDLRKKDVLSYSVADSPGVFYPIPYALINNAIVLKFPDKKDNADVQFKIKELTDKTLKVIIHIKFIEDGKMQDLDLIQMDFDVKE